MSAVGVHTKFETSFMKDIDGVSYIGKPKSRTMMYLSKKIESKITLLSNVSGCLVFLQDNIAIPEALKERHVFILCADPNAAYTEVALRLMEKIEADYRRRRYSNERGYWQGENVAIGEDVFIEPGAFIDHDVCIGNHVVIRSGARIRRKTIIGDECVIGENCVIGDPAFNIAELPRGEKREIPCFGGVVLGKRVFIGAGTVISRGSGDDTVLEDDVKVDALVRIGHDARLERGVELRGTAAIGGYCEIAEGSVIATNATLKNRMAIGKNCFVGMGSVVHHGLRDGMTVSGSPARSLELIGKERYLQARLKEIIRNKDETS